MQRGLSSRLGLGLIFLCFFGFGLPTFAGKVTGVKGKTVRIKLSKKEKGKVMVGDKIYLTRKGKKKAVVKVRKVKGRRVVGKIVKGKAKKGYRTKMKKKKSMADSEYADGSVVSEDSSSGRSDLMFGIMGGYGLASQTVNQGPAGSSEQSGSSLAVKGLVDYSLFGDIGVRANIGVEMFSVEGDGQNVNTSVDEVIGTEITYLSIDVLLRYRFMLSSSMFGYVNGGIGIFSPLSSSSTSLDENSISTTSIVIVGGGIGFGPLVAPMSFLVPTITIFRHRKTSVPRLFRLSLAWFSSSKPTTSQANY